jgi:hypothetical protein
MRALPSLFDAACILASPSVLRAEPPARRLPTKRALLSYSTTNTPRITRQWPGKVQR